MSTEPRCTCGHGPAVHRHKHGYCFAGTNTQPCHCEKYTPATPPKAA